MSTTTAPSAARSGPSSPGHVAPVALDDRRLDLVDVAADLAHPALGPHARRRGDVQLQRGVREHDGADVAALDHAATAFAGPLRWRRAAPRAPRVLAATALTASVTSRPADADGGVDAVDDTPSSSTDRSSRRASSATRRSS